MQRTKDKKAQELYREKLKQITENTAINPFETRQEQSQRIALAKKDYNYFVNTYFSRYATAPCGYFHIDLAKRIKSNPSCKLLLGWGRGLAKSTHVDLLIPMWLWINDDIKVMVLVGENADKASVLLSDIQAEFEANQLLIHDFGSQQTIGSWEDGKFVTKNDCAFFSLGIGQSVRGLRHRNNRPDYGVCDDLDTKQICKNPKRVREYANWVSEDFLGALNPVRNRFTMVNNIFAPLTILTQLRDTKKGYTFIQLDAEDVNGNVTWAANKTLAPFYAIQKETMGILSFNAEYNNKPYTEGTIFTEDMIQWSAVPRITQFDSIIGFWDVAYSEAKTADYNAIKLWGIKNGNFYLIKAFVRQCKMDVAIAWVNDYMQSLPSGISINWYFESQFWNDALMMVHAEVSRRYINPVQFIKSEKPTGAKIDRLMNMLPYYQQRRIFYNINEKNNSDMQIGIAQLFGIEAGYKGHDDSPDADAQAIEKLSKRSRNKNGKYVVGLRRNFSNWGGD
jgi:phage terminase large subunit-like protein